MISVYNIKPKFQQLLRPVLGKLHDWKISPNQLSLFAVLLSALLGFGFWLHPYGKMFFDFTRRVIVPHGTQCARRDDGKQL